MTGGSRGIGRTVAQRLAGGRATAVVTGLLTLGAASVVGGAAGYTCQLLQRRFAAPAGTPTGA